MSKPAFPRDGSKACLWCGETFYQKRHSKSEWLKVKCCCLSCAAYYAKHQRPKFDVAAMPPRTCAHCEKPLVKGAEEQNKAWIKRRFCDKKCAATGRKGTRAVVEVNVVTDEQRLGLTRYIPGTPEFEQIARLYL